MDNVSRAYMGGGCFWCTEAVFSRLKGVLSVQPGYMGGKTVNPTYEQICTGLTNHAEVVEVTFDANIISYKQLLEVFFATHDPLSLNRQGADVGTQYRSVLYYLDENQKETALQTIDYLNENNYKPNTIVTEISPMVPFYKAEVSHKEYYDRNPYHSYCQYVIAPKIIKLNSYFEEIVK